jgi:hypothetical protein
MEEALIGVKRASAGTARAKEILHRGGKREAPRFFF